MITASINTATIIGTTIATTITALAAIGMEADGLIVREVEDSV